jgi:hypothetical protein
MEKKTSYFLGFLFLTIFSIGCFWIGMNFIQDASQAQDWPTTDGVITYSAVDSHSSHDGNLYAPNVQYTYTVNGVKYSSNGIIFGTISTSDGGYANEMVNRYYVGKTVTVYYNPENPSDALLEPGIMWIYYLPIVFGLILLLIGIVLLIFVIKRRSGVKRLEITLDKTVYSPGETINGKVFLRLKKPIQARSLKAMFVGEKIISRYSGRRGGRSEQYFPFVKEEAVLDGEIEYYEKEYSFLLRIPDDVFNRAEHWGEGVAMVGNKTVQLGEKTAAMQVAAKHFLENIGVVGQGRNSWYVAVELDVFHGMNLRNEVQINIQ